MDSRYYTIQMWMVKQLGLKGIERDVFAIIYGFCQDRKSSYHGSIDYISDMIGHPGRSVMNVLKDLTNKNLLLKKEIYGVGNIYNVNFELLDNVLGGEVSNISPEVSGNVPPEVSSKSPEVSSGNNKEDNNILENNKEDNCKTLGSTTLALGKDSSRYNKKLQRETEVDTALRLLNKLTGASYSVQAAGNRRPVRARLNEGYSLQDLETVIRFKYDEWGKRPVKFSNGKMSNEYLRPSTLFGNKFDEYLQQSKRSNSSEGGVKIASVEPSKNKSGVKFV